MRLGVRHAGAEKMASLQGQVADFTDGQDSCGGEGGGGVVSSGGGGWSANFSAPLIRLNGFDRLGLRLNVAYNTQYQSSHVFFLGGESRLCLNFTLPFLPPAGLSLQVSLSLECLPPARLSSSVSSSSPPANRCTRHPFSCVSAPALCSLDALGDSGTAFSSEQRARAASVCGRRRAAARGQGASGCQGQRLLHQAPLPAAVVRQLPLRGDFSASTRAPAALTWLRAYWHGVLLFVAPSNLCMQCTRSRVLARSQHIFWHATTPRYGRYRCGRYGTGRMSWSGNICVVRLRTTGCKLYVCFRNRALIKASMVITSGLVFVGFDVTAAM